MIRHLLLFRWTEQSEAADRAAALEALRGMKETVPEIRSLAVRDGLAISPGAYDGLLEAEFADQDAYGRYLVAESHQRAWTEYLQPVCADLASIQVGA
jgi:hypothetical protein